MFPWPVSIIPARALLPLSAACMLKIICLLFIFAPAHPFMHLLFKKVFKDNFYSRENRYFCVK